MHDTQRQLAAQVMTDEQRHLAVQHAVQHAMTRYGPGWDHVPFDARFGAVMRRVMADFPTYLHYDKYSAADIVAIARAVACTIEST